MKELRPFFSGKRFPCAGHQPFKCHMHDPNTMQREHAVSKDLAHTPDLSIASLGEDDTESGWAEPLNPAGLGWAVENIDPLSHAVDEGLIERTIDRHLVFPLMPVFSS
jgi:hypothetical protein